MEVEAGTQKTSPVDDAPSAAQRGNGRRSSASSLGRQNVIPLNDPLPQASNGGLPATTFWAGVGALLMATVAILGVFAPDLHSRPALPRIGASSDPIVKQAPRVLKEVTEATAQTESLTRQVRDNLSTASTTDEQGTAAK